MAALISIIPILLLFVLMLGFKMAGHKSAFVTLVVTILLALFVAPAMDMLPERFAAAPATDGLPVGTSAPATDGLPVGTATVVGVVWWAFVEGVLKAVFPSRIILLMAIYSYNILVESKQIEVIKQQFTSFTDDKGILVLMLVWGFGGLLEGMAGFGTAVAIPAAILIGLGFKPMFSALVALIGNTVATGFGAVGVPVTTLCNEVAPGGAASPEAICQISGYAVLQLAPLFILLPFIILWLTDRKAVVKNLVLAVWVGGVSLAVQYVCARYLGAETPAIIGSVAAIVAIVVYARLFARRKPASPVVSPAASTVPSTVADGSAVGASVAPASVAPAADGSPVGTSHTPMETFRAWSVYLFILLFILVSGALCPPVNAFLKTHLVSEVPLPVIGSTFKFGWISNAGLMLFLGATIGGLIQGLSLRKLMVVLARTVVNLRKTVVTIVSLIALASVMNYCGMIAAIASGLVALTGSFYPFFAPLIGAVGTFVTGSDTSSNILFAKLQANVAGQLNYSDPNWLVAANTTGATGGKMISPQSIAIATAACDMQGKDGEILKSALPYALLYIIIGGLMVYFAV